MRKLFKGGNCSRAEAILGNTQYILSRTQYYFEAYKLNYNKTSTVAMHLRAVALSKSKKFFKKVLNFHVIQESQVQL